MGGTHIFFVMPAKVGAGGNQLCAGGPRRPTHASRRGRRGRQAGLLPVWRSPLTLNGPCRCVDHGSRPPPLVRRVSCVAEVLVNGAIVIGAITIPL